MNENSILYVLLALQWYTWITKSTHYSYSNWFNFQGFHLLVYFYAQFMEKIATGVMCHRQRYNQVPRATVTTKMQPSLSHSTESLNFSIIYAGQLTDMLFYVPVREKLSKRDKEDLTQLPAQTGPTRATITEADSSEEMVFKRCARRAIAECENTTENSCWFISSKKWEQS